MNRRGGGEEIGGKEMDGCPFTIGCIEATLASNSPQSNK
jgi:hypothetical protein